LVSYPDESRVFFESDSDPASPSGLSNSILVAVNDVVERLKAALTGRYTVERELGRGGMATVLLAQDNKHHRPVAIKLLKPELSAIIGPERFLCEIEIAARLHHPHILPLYDSGEADGLLFYVMPFAEGESLRARLGREKQLPVEDALQIAREVADALSYAHSHDLVHRDIKPENILLESGHAVVADFGIARAITAAGGETLTQTGMVIGTPAYMSPEQAAGSRDLDGRSDLYSLGCVLYEMLAGQPPFMGPTVESVVHQHLTVEPHPITSLRPAVPAEVAAALARALAKTPADRFNPVALFAESLRSAGAGRPAPPVALWAPRAGRRAVTARLAVAGVVTLIAVLALIKARQRSARAREALAAATAAAAAHHFDDVYQQLRTAGLDVTDRRLASLLPAAAGALTITTDPPGATVEAIRVQPVSGFATRSPLHLGRSPLRTVALVVGDYLIRLELEGHHALSLTLTIDVGVERHLLRQLVRKSDTALAGVVLVDSGATAALTTPASVPAFFMGRHEVTNGEFLTFVKSGAYRDSTLWTATMRVGGRRSPRDLALRRFVDRTGQPGPRPWSSGTFPNAEADHPVTGVSWYEAAAYAQWAHQTLPTKAQWYRAALGDGDGVYPWGNDAATAEVRANFGLAGTRPVGSFPLGVSPFGCDDMAGNVREWLADSMAGGQRLAAGGSWQDPPYMFEPGHTEAFEPEFSSSAIGFRVAAVAGPTRKRGDAQ
jgi:hypothetical protein